MARTNKKSLSILSKDTKTLMRINNVYFTTKECEVFLESLGWVDALSEDSYTVFCCLNTWCSLFEDIVGKSGNILATHIRINGFHNAIREADDYRLGLLRDEEDHTSFWYDYIHSPVNSEKLTLLGLPRRLRVVGKPISSEVTDFIAGNLKARNHNRSLYEGTILKDTCVDTDMMYSPSGNQSYDEWLTIHSHTPEFLVQEAARLWELIFRNWRQHDELFILPPGVTFEGAHTYLEKFDIVCEQQNWLRERGVKLPTLPANKFAIPVNCCRYGLVPKTFKSLRGIAPEPVSRQVLGYQIDAGMRECLQSFGCNLTDQNRNRLMSQCDELFTTVDFTAASDSISLWLVDRLSQTTPDLRARLMDCRSDNVMVEGKMFTNYRFATMGNACTFAVESAVFLIICLLAIELQENKRFTRAKLLTVAKESVSVYGDDCIIPNDYYETFCEISTLFGFSVNREKSYSVETKYRESCGAEWYNGTDVSGTYWPRGLSNEPLAELVSLQHKFVEYPTANAFLTTVILDVFPDITQSEVGSLYQDIWCNHPIAIRSGKSPYARFEYEVFILPYEEAKEYCSKLSIKGKEPRRSWHRIDSLNSPVTDCTIENRTITRHLVLSKASDLPSDRIRRVLVPIPCDLHEDNYEVHTTISSVSTGNLSSAQRGRVELLGYLLSLGRGIEHINSSPYTKPQDMIMDRRDLVRKRKVKIQNRRYVL